MVFFMPFSFISTLRLLLRHIVLIYGAARTLTMQAGARDGARDAEGCQGIGVNPLENKLGNQLIH